MKKFILLSIFCCQCSYGQVFRSYSNEFLTIGVDAASFGMGRAVTATTQGVNAGYWNPAGLVGISDYQGSLMHAEYFQGIAKYDYIGVAKPLDETRTIAVSILRFAVDDILNTTQLIEDGQINYDRISLFSAADWAINIGYANKLKFKHLDIGINAKIIKRRIGKFASAIGFGFDAGLQFREGDWLFGLMFRDITTTFNAWSFDNKRLGDILAIYDDFNEAILNDDDPYNDDTIIPTGIPEKIEITKPKMQLGVARSFPLGRNYHLLTSLDLNVRFTETNDIVSSSAMSMSPSFGFQLDFDNLVFLRGGVMNFQQQTQFDNRSNVSLEPNIGLGFNYKGIQVDYALSNIGGANGTLFSNVFSVKVDFSYFR
ncbi:PorV/PorQ family protein [Flavobacteriaceae bacterium F08102]|nr:PorV/PorQ family protein [Flavobacteriaceae bacterium F08102]